MQQVLFNFTLHNSISEIKENFVELKEQLNLGLHLRPYEAFLLSNFIYTVQLLSQRFGFLMDVKICKCGPLWSLIKLANFWDCSFEGH